jgi:hypothetical protein
LGARDVDVFEDSNLIVQQVRGDSQCLDGVLNSYQDRCLDNIKLYDTFSINHIPQEENSLGLSIYLGKRIVGLTS